LKKLGNYITGEIGGKGKLTRPFSKDFALFPWFLDFQLACSGRDLLIIIWYKIENFNNY
jgi:hypothetical protein